MTGTADRLPDIEVEIPARPEYVGVVRHLLQHLPVKSLGSIAPSRLIMRDGGLEVTQRLCRPRADLLFVCRCHP